MGMASCLFMCIVRIIMAHQTPYIMKAAPRTVLYYSGEPADITDEQRVSIERIAKIHRLPSVVRVETLPLETCIMVKVDEGLTIGIEADGYAHS